jgi:hypothetical protein
MNAANFDIAALMRMRHSPVRNYAIPGLTSWLIGEPSPRGTVRMFECSREHVEPISPHSHRFDFQSWVLRGTVRNRIWRSDTSADLYRQVRLKYDGDIGRYIHEPGSVSRWGFEDHVYNEGECYSMKYYQVHSIYFSRGAVVLFFEGPQVTEQSIALEPVVDGVAVPTFKVEPWMFLKEDHASSSA